MSKKLLRIPLLVTAAAMILAACAAPTPTPAPASLATNGPSPTQAPFNTKGPVPTATAIPIPGYFHPATPGNCRASDADQRPNGGRLTGQTQ